MTGDIFVYESIIFSHDFAKAFWGTDKVNTWAIDEKEFKENYDEDEMEWCDNCSSQMIKAAWEYHLERMVLEKDRLKYLEKFL